MHNSNYLKRYKEISKEEYEIAELTTHYVVKSGAKTLLDIGAGNGSFAKIVKATLPKLTIHGVEPFQSLTDNEKYFESLFKSKVEDFHMQKDYDIILLSHVLGHITEEDNYRYTVLLEELSIHANSYMIICTNSLIGDFKYIQNKIWEFTNDDSYYIDLKKLISPFLERYKVEIIPFNVEISLPTSKQFYNILEVFSPVRLPRQIPEFLQSAIKRFEVDNKWSLTIPQFFIAINTSMTKTNSHSQISKSDLENHDDLWTKLTK